MSEAAKDQQLTLKGGVQFIVLFYTYYILALVLFSDAAD